MTAFFMDCQKILGKRSDISGEVIYAPGRINYHHVMPKELYKNLQYSFNNIIVCTAQQHEEIHNDPQKYEIVQKKIIFIRENMEFCIQQNQSWSDCYDKKQSLIWLTQNPED